MIVGLLTMFFLSWGLDGPGTSTSTGAGAGVAVDAGASRVRD